MITTSNNESDEIDPQKLDCVLENIQQLLYIHLVRSRDAATKSGVQLNN